MSERPPMTDECRRIAAMVEARELDVRPGRVVTHHLSFGTAWVQLPNYVEYAGKRYWVEDRGRL